MGAAEIVEKMKNEANAECGEILSEAKENAKKKIEDAREEVELQKKNFAEAEERKGVEELARVVRATRLNARKLGWDTEEEMIGRALDGAMKRLKEIKTEGFKGNSYGFKGNSYSNILAGLIKDAALSMVDGSSASSELEVILSDEDASYVDKSLLNELSDGISAGSVNVRLSLSGEGERIKSAGGVIVRRKDGRIEVNNTSEQRMRRFSTSLKEDVVKVLFKDKGLR